MTDKEIREAIERKKKNMKYIDISQDDLKLIDLAEKYLACSGVMPKEETCIANQMGEVECNKCAMPCQNKYRNQAINECTLALTKKRR